MADLFAPLQLDPSLMVRPAAPMVPSGASQAKVAPGNVKPGSVMPGNVTPANITKAAHDFEAMAIAQFLQPMFNTVDTAKGPFGGGAGEEAWRPMLVEQLAKKLADHGGLGLAKQIQAAMERAQGGVPGGMPGDTPSGAPGAVPGAAPGILQQRGIRK
ncbi:MAG TPA: rod-binding protein [Rhodopila sp.]|uniref:rod-binding protein n=1 Tax=Rhodopila sp. TaxID=2480087 RepID=UPI002C829E6B|nr:rod-binding protein [Rhodopila sp.]HVY17290.1 rod-binding protein [Rhodopila sp.]